jgi:exodeoxyribonuclease VII large subunit
LWVKGELSGVTYHTSGHIYFSLKDSGSLISAVIFRGRASKLKFKLTNGQSVEALGAISVYEPRGQYQLVAEVINQEGQGDLQLAFEQLKKKLESEGLFEAKRKRAIPLYPDAVGIVTSPTSAAIIDMIDTTALHFPKVVLRIYPAVVQGETSPESIIKAIELANRHAQVDVLIVGRGGGSQEDLWAFNDEALCRAIATSKIPIISAVGHAVDFSLADFVADARAETPTAAAERISLPKKQLVKNLQELDKRVAGNIFGLLKQIRIFLQAHDRTRLLRKLENALQEKWQLHDELVQDGLTAIEEKHRKLKELFLRMASKLEALSPFKVLGRGYSVVLKEGKVITQASELQTNDEIDIRFYKNRVKAKIL